MNKPFLIFFLLIQLVACDNTLKATKVETENYNNELYETYLVSNVSNLPKVRYPNLLNTVVKKRVREVSKTDTRIVRYVVEFYDDVACTRRYYKNHKHLKGVESIIERCEEYYCGGFTYEKSQENDNKWYLVYPKNIKDTIYCK